MLETLLLAIKMFLKSVYIMSKFFCFMISLFSLLFVSKIIYLFIYSLFQFSANLVTFTEEILNLKLHFLCSATIYYNTKTFVLRICRRAYETTPSLRVKIFIKVGVMKTATTRLCEQSNFVNKHDLLWNIVLILFRYFFL